MIGYPENGNVECTGAAWSAYFVPYDALPRVAIGMSDYAPELHVDGIIVIEKYKEYMLSRYESRRFSRQGKMIDLRLQRQDLHITQFPSSFSSNVHCPQPDRSRRMHSVGMAEEAHAT